MAIYYPDGVEYFDIPLPVSATNGNVDEIKKYFYDFSISKAVKLNSSWDLWFLLTAFGQCFRNAKEVIIDYEDKEIMLFDHNYEPMIRNTAIYTKFAEFLKNLKYTKPTYNQKNAKISIDKLADIGKGNDTLDQILNSLEQFVRDCPNYELIIITETENKLLALLVAYLLFDRAKQVFYEFGGTNLLIFEKL